MPLKRHSKPYIPRADGAPGLLSWLNNFAAVLAESPSSFGVSASEVAKVNAIAKRYAKAYLAARAPATRGAVATKAKDAARRDAWSVVRPLSMRIKRNLGVPEAMKITLGIYPPRKGGSPIPPTRHAPLLAIEKALPRILRMRYQDAENPSRWATPPGVVHMQLLVIVGRKAKLPRSFPGTFDTRGRPLSPRRLAGSRDREFIHFATRHVFNVPFRQEDVGMVATCFGRWVTKRGLTSPWSAPVSMTIV